MANFHDKSASWRHESKMCDSLGFREELTCSRNVSKRRDRMCTKQNATTGTFLVGGESCRVRIEAKK